MSRRRDEDEITPAQRGYLNALDQCLRARCDQDETNAVVAMSVMADLIREEAGITPRPRRHGPHRPRVC